MTLKTTCDFLVIGSGSAAMSAALRAASAGLTVQVIEKTPLLGGTSAMSGAGIWIPANHIAQAAGIEDSPQEALAYIRAAAPQGWAKTEDALWQAFATQAPRALKFIDEHTPLEFVVTKEPDPFAELSGGKNFGHQLTVKTLSRWIMGWRFGRRMRPSTLAHLFSYQELVSLDPYHHPIRVGLKLLPKLVWRFLTNSRGQGNAMVTGLVRGCLDLGVTFHLETPALKLVQNAGGRVTGAEVGHNGLRTTVTARRGVLLATGGFEWNKGMRDEHFPGGVKFLASPSANVGDGHQMAAQAGALLDRMDQANIYPCLPTVYEGRSTGLPYTFPAEKHAILVNRHGKRFVSENDFNIGEKLDERDPRTGTPLHLPVWLIGDQRFLRQSIPFLWYARKKKNFLVRANSLAELSQKTNLPTAALAETITRFNQACDSGDDLDFQRGQSAWDKYKSHDAKAQLYKIAEGPFVAIEVSRSILGTKGGARTDAKARVLRENGSVIEGLFAAGLTMANPFGTRAIGAGTTLGPCLTWGFICGESIANLPSFDRLI